MENTGGCTIGGSGSGQGPGVSTSLAVLESKERRIRLEDVDSNEGVREGGNGDEERE